MGNGISTSERLYLAVQKSSQEEVRRLHAQGAALEWRDKQGRTPLMLACAYGELYDMARTLLTLGANVHAFRGGTEGGFPLHHAAKKGNDRTCALLMAHGGDPLALNDEGLSAIDKGREKGHVNVVRVLEDRIALFRGNMREQVMSGPGFFEALAGSLLYKACYVVVLPCEPDRRRQPKFALVVYTSHKDSRPRYVIPLVTAELELKKGNTADPVLIVADNSPGSKTKLKLLGSPEQQGQVLQLYNACRGVVQGAPAPPMPQPAPVPPHHPAPVQPPPPFSQHPPFPPYPTLPAYNSVPPPTSYTAAGAAPGPSSSSVSPQKGARAPDAEGSEDQALAMAIAASLESARQEGHSRQSSAPELPSQGEGAAALERHSSDPSQLVGGDRVQRYGGWAPAEASHGGWGGPVMAPPEQAPSAPPLPGGFEGAASVGDRDRVGYPSVGGGDATCSVCLDQAANAICVPCGHVAGCLECLSEIKEKGMGCPICRAPIQQVIKVYLPS